ncbi:MULTISPECIES: hypothetical protein [unclassified Microcoleus]|uniref:hypothetical protein n=1 Tax=unclassified Microcoleus TaxID=2642155 RepID=UPI002FD488ED
MTYAALAAALQSGQELLPAAVPMLSESAIDGVEDVEVEWALWQTDSGDKGKAAAMATIRATLSRFNQPGRQAEIWSLNKTVKMEKMRMSNTEREEVFKDITRQASPEQTIVANERSGYRMPPEYITRKTLVQIDLACTVICSEAQEDPRSFLNRFQGDSINLAMNLTFATGFSLWLKSSSLLYCVTKELAKALIETDILDKKNILTDLIWPFPQIVVAIPRFLLCPPGTTDVYVDFLLVSSFKKPGKETQWISICFVDTIGNI